VISISIDHNRRALFSVLSYVQIMKNSGKSYEKMFVDHLQKSRGVTHFLHRFTDASDIKGRTGLVTKQPKQPSDFISVIDGVTAFTEVKSTQNPSRFSFSLLSPHQHARASQIQRAGGTYIVFVFAIEHSVWFRVPYSIIQQHHDVASLPWLQLEHLQWT
jgi:penicillin-binding protein-related factor A (putative recombinase)